MAVGMDIEHSIHAGDPAPDNILGMPMKLPTPEELRSFVRSTKLPFFIKGVLSVVISLAIFLVTSWRTESFAILREYGSKVWSVIRDKFRNKTA